MLRRIAPGLGLVVAWILCSLPLAAAPAAASRPASVEQMALRVVQLTNAIRAQHGLSPLQVHPALIRSAGWMARDMSDHNYLRHTDYQGRNIDPRLPSFGYDDYRAIGENIAGGQATPEEVVADWMRSPSHRANLLNPEFREIGVAYVHGDHNRYKHYWVQDFGVRADTFPVVINNKSSETASPLVHLYLYGEGWAQEMRFSNDRIHWSDWTPYQARTEWMLSAGYGRRTVYAEVRGGGVTRRSADTIELSPGQRNALLAAAITVHSAR